jgi:hypothetical protein
VGFSSKYCFKTFFPQKLGGKQENPYPSEANLSPELFSIELLKFTSQYHTFRNNQLGLLFFLSFGDFERFKKCLQSILRPN